MFHPMQHTIDRPVQVAGFGYWSGKDVHLEFRPSGAGSGIVFVRRDIGAHARVTASVQNREDVTRRTNLHNGLARVEMVEHVLAALFGLGIDNCEVWSDQAEMPGCDGSALPFVEALETARVIQQCVRVKDLVVQEPLRLIDGDCWIEARPAVGGGFLVEYQLEYPNAPVIGKQTTRHAVTPAIFRRDLAPARTFVLEHEAREMVRNGLGERVTPSDLLYFNDTGLVENKLRFRNECARHKVLDLVGDLALTGYRVQGYFVAHRSGHRLNAAMATKLIDVFAHTSPLRQTA
jgi:UDP-3-O-[3-hydroxymyristoyl] N-acetylglucosamine deacetylase